MACGRVRFFLDNNLPPKVAHALDCLLEPKDSAEHLRDKFPADTPDEVWMAELGREADLIILSGDSAISRNPHEVRAWKEAGHPIFFLKPAWIHLQIWEFASKLFHCFPEIMKLAQKARPGSGFLVPVRGSIREIDVGRK
jgi:PIN like domain